MRRLFIIIILTATCLHASAFGVRTEYDYGFASLIASTYKAAGAIEDMSGKSLEQIVKEYRSASIATVGIWATKYADRKAMKDAGLLGTQENYYYRHIRYLVENLIIPRIYCIGKYSLKHPDKAIYWGPYLLDAMKKTKESCMQFQRRNSATSARISPLMISSATSRMPSPIFAGTSRRRAAKASSGISRSSPRNSMTSSTPSRTPSTMSPTARCSETPLNRSSATWRTRWP